MGQPHKHAEIIKAWADGAEIEWLWKRPDHQEWIPCPETEPPTWNEEIEFRIKPEPPKYPQTKMTDQELTKFWCDSQHGQYVGGCLRTVANAAIARAIEDGQVFTIENYVDAMKFCSEPMVPAAMLEKVALEVQKACKPTLIGTGGGCGGGGGGADTSVHGGSGYSNAMQVHVPNPDLSAIIAKVKECK